MEETYKVDIHLFKNDKDILGFIPTTFNVVRLSDFVANLLDRKEFISPDEFHRVGANIMNSNELDEIWNGLCKLKVLQAIKENDAVTDIVNLNNQNIPHTITGLDFVLSECNLRCIYCYSDSGQYHNKITPMSLDVAKKAIDFYNENAPAGANLGVGFEGGEPLLQYKLIQDIVNYAENKLLHSERSIKYMVATNGTVFHPEIAELLKHYKFRTSISLDGKRETQNRQRPFKNGDGSFDLIMKNVKAYEDAGVKLEGVCITVTPDSIEFASEVEALFALGFKAVFVNFVRSGNRQLMFSLDNASTIGEQFAFLNDSINNNHSILANYATPVNIITNRKARIHWCSGGRVSVAVTGDGRLYPCSGFVEMPEYQFGTVDQGISKSIQNRFILNDVNSKATCQKCWARTICGGGCNHMANISHEKIEEPDHVHCEIIRNTIDAALKYIVRFPQKAQTAMNEENQHGF